VVGGELALAGESLLDAGALLALLGFEFPPLWLDELQWHRVAMPTTNARERKIVRFIVDRPTVSGFCGRLRK
jgi:hypothetical protein